MRKIKDVLRLFYEVKLSQRAIALALSIGLGTVSTYLQRAREAGINWPLPADMNERDLGRLLFPSQPATGQRPVPVLNPDTGEIREAQIFVAWLTSTISFVGDN